MAKGPKDRDGESTTDELTEIHRGVDQEAPREGLRPPANLSTENRTTVSSIAGTIQESRPPRNSRREVHDGRATSSVPRIPGASLYRGSQADVSCGLGA